MKKITVLLLGLVFSFGMFGQNYSNAKTTANIITSATDEGEWDSEAPYHEIIILTAMDSTMFTGEFYNSNFTEISIGNVYDEDTENNVTMFYIDNNLSCVRISEKEEIDGIIEDVYSYYMVDGDKMYGVFKGTQKSENIHRGVMISDNYKPFDPTLDGMGIIQSFIIEMYKPIGDGMMKYFNSRPNYIDFLSEDYKIFFE